jgi:hypothetical protein
MAYDYAALRDGSVAEVLAEYGGTATLTQWTKGAFSTADRDFGDGSTANYDVTVVVADYDETEIDGSVIQRDDKQVIMGGAEQAPRLNDKITIPKGGVQYEIISITPIKPDGSTVVAYFMQARK